MCQNLTIKAFLIVNLLKWLIAVNIWHNLCCWQAGKDTKTSSKKSEDDGISG